MLAIEKITPEMVELAEKPSVWHIGDQALYDLCVQNPRHDKPDAIVAKFLLIGRTYAAAVERRRIIKSPSDDFYERDLVGAIKPSAFDDRLSALPRKSEFTPRTVGLAIELHKYLMDILHKITGLNKRSLVSKYLHFHRPDLFFIYDSRARSKAFSLVSGLESQPVIECGDHDGEYMVFYQRCLCIRQYILDKYGRPLTPRQLDNLLLRMSPAQEPQSSVAPPES